MPTYDYACRNCGHEFEIFQNITAQPLKKCPACRRQGLQRLIGAGAGIIFKGSGFYETDYKRANSRSAQAPASGNPPEKTEKTESSANPSANATSTSD